MYIPPSMFNFPAPPPQHFNQVSGGGVGKQNACSNAVLYICTAVYMCMYSSVLSLSLSAGVQWGRGEGRRRRRFCTVSPKQPGQSGDSELLLRSAAAAAAAAAAAHPKQSLHESACLSAATAACHLFSARLTHTGTDAQNRSQSNCRSFYSRGCFGWEIVCLCRSTLSSAFLLLY